MGSIRWPRSQLRQAPRLTTKVLLFLVLHLPLDKSWWCRDSAPQGARSAGSYIPRSGRGLRMPSRMGGSALSLGIPVTQVWRALWTPFMGAA